jgi:hypothetical protein
MGQLLHKCARTTEKTHREIQLSKESIATLARQYVVNRKTVAKWKPGLLAKMDLWGLK